MFVYVHEYIAWITPEPRALLAAVDCDTTTTPTPLMEEPTIDSP